MAMDNLWQEKTKSIFQKIKSIAVLLLPIALYFIPVKWLNGQHSICLFKNIFGVECYGCGITRAVLSVIQLNFYDAFQYNKLVIIVFPILAYLWLKYVIKELRIFW